MTTTDAEAIARIIDPSAFNPDAQTIGKPAYWEAKREWAVRTATAILSYLASRREAQEPVGYTSGGELERLREWSRHADAIGVVGEKTTTRCIPLYTTPPSPAPAGEVERLRGALDNCIDTLALVEQPSFIDKVYATDVAILGDRIGYGALMSCASALWRLRLSERGSPVGGEFVSGPCHATVLSTLKQARAALNGGRSE